LIKCMLFLDNDFLISLSSSKGKSTIIIPSTILLIFLMNLFNPKQLKDELIKKVDSLEIKNS